MTDLTALSDTLRGLLGPDFGIGVADPRAPSAPLWDAEKPAMARAVPKRILEFTAGRTAARTAMADIGIEPAAIPMGDDRAPVWPDGIIGSIAHCDSAAIAAVAPKGSLQSIGLDIEEATPLAADLWNTVCTATEREWLASQPAKTRGLLAKQIFSAKEAVYKAQYPLTGKLIGFGDVEISLKSKTFSSRITLRSGISLFNGSLTGRVCRTEDLILSVGVCPAPSPPDRTGTPYHPQTVPLARNQQ